MFAKVWVLTGAEQLPDMSSFCTHAAKLFVEATASTWHIAWYICHLGLSVIIK